MSQVLNVHGGHGASLQLRILRTLCWAARPIGQRGVHRVAWQLARVFDERNAAVVQTWFGRMHVPLGDGYAVKLLDRDYRYEPEVEPYISEAMRRGCFLIDAGANLGYWTLVASHLAPGPGHVVAVEPVPSLHALLETNRALNGERFSCERAALWANDGVELTLVSHPQWHAGSSAVHPDGRRHRRSYSFTAPTVTVDSLVRRHCRDPGPILVKLDVEGAEPQALAGAHDTLRERDTLLLYEDHGSDPRHTSSRYVLEELGYRVFACTSHGPRPVTSLHDVAAQKPDSQHGFNFLAFSPHSAVGPDLLESCRTSGRNLTR